MRTHEAGPEPQGQSGSAREINQAAVARMMTAATAHAFAAARRLRRGPGGLGIHHTSTPHAAQSCSRADSPEMRQLSVDHTGRLWGISSDKKLYLRSGVTEETPDGRAWTLVTDTPGSLSQNHFFVDVDGCSMSAWALRAGRTRVDLLFREDVDSPTFWLHVKDGRVRLGRGRVVGAHCDVGRARDRRLGHLGDHHQREQSGRDVRAVRRRRRARRGLLDRS